VDHRTATSQIEIRRLMIPTRDGTRLGATLFLPRLDRRVPVVVEFTPYRKDDFRGAGRDFGSFYLAEHGIAAVQLDVRGTGQSEGFVIDEYEFPQEQHDGYDALEWLARQDWCNGRTGLWGTSYAGFNALQIAQTHPPSLGAIAPIYATDDRYTDDVHFLGGALRGWHVIGAYALGMLSRNALPPYPEPGEEGWRALWDLRLERNIPWLIRWVEEQLDGPYWRSTLARLYDRVRVPTLIIAGWADYYINAAVRWFQHLTVPKKLIVGPWPHTPPDAATPGPRIDFMREVTRWFAQWLADEPTGILDEPPVTLYVQASRRPEAAIDVAPGFWRFEDALPPARVQPRAWFLGARADLVNRPPVADHVASRRYVPFVGFADMGFGGSGVGWGEQGANEAFSLTYTSRPLARDLEILGFPRIELYVSATAPVAFFAVRLCDVAPDGTSMLVTKGLLNVTRRAGMDQAEPLVPDQVYRLEFDLNATSWLFPRGHRIRIAVSGADFPEVWPSPYACDLRVHTGSAFPSRLTLPVVPAGPNRPEPVLLPPPPRRSQFIHEAGPVQTWVTYDVARHAMIAGREAHERLRRPDGTEATTENRLEMLVPAMDPAGAVATARDRKTVRQPGFEVESVATAELRGDASAFQLHLTLRVTFNGALYWSREWWRTIPRVLL
jgi:putative CocE/NonD family hydrolase